MDVKVCRVCCENQASSYIFKTNKNNIELSTKIMYCCSNLIIKEGDGLPSHLCGGCEQELEACYTFVLKCEAADLKFRSQSFGIISHTINHYGTKFELKTELDGDEDHQYEDSRELDITLQLKQDAEIKDDVFLKRKPNKKRAKNKDAGSRKCSVCSRNCANPSALAVHMRVHTNEKPYLCTFCDKRYKDNGNLKRHIDRKHHPGRERNFICEHCGKGFYCKRDVKIHMRTHTGETPYVCTMCPKRFSQMSTLMRHKIRHTGQKSHTCPVCTKAFCTKEELKSHLLVHSSDKKYSCPICNLAFKYQNNVKKHLKVHAEPNRFVCNYCGRTFNLKGNLKIHIDSQHSEKSGYCSVCLKNFSNIEVHMWRHTGHRPLKCELCSSSFFELKALGRHMNYRHKQTDKYKCTVESCFMAFPSRPMLEFHTAKLHSTGIPFPCDRCSRGFYRKNDLARHKIGTHKERLL